MIATTAHRVSSHTSNESNNRIAQAADFRLAYYERHPEQVQQRLRELDREWDIERVLELGSSSLTLTGLLLSIAKDRRWLLLSLGVQGFFLQHAMQGWCPPLPVFRRLGFRTADEINRERYALRAIQDQDAQVRRDEGATAPTGV